MNEHLERETASHMGTKLGGDMEKESAKMMRMSRAWRSASRSVGLTAVTPPGFQQVITMFPGGWMIVFNQLLLFEPTGRRSLA